MEPFDHASALKGCARQDPAALRRLYDREAGFLLAVALRIVRRRDVAVDVLHDAFLDIWERAGSFDSSRGTGRAWITSIVRYRALKYIRAASRETDIDAVTVAEIVDAAPDPFAALAASQDGVRLHGCTVHFVVPELDAGPIVAQAAIPVRQDDDPDSLADRVIVQERRLYPAVLALVAGGRARLDGDRVVIADEAPDGVLFSL